MAAKLEEIMKVWMQYSHESDMTVILFVSFYLSIYLSISSLPVLTFLPLPVYRYVVI